MDDLPIPKLGETLQEFVARCHVDAAMLKKYPKGHDRRLAAQRRWWTENPPEVTAVLDKLVPAPPLGPELPKRQPQDGPESLSTEPDDS